MTDKYEHLIRTFLTASVNKGGRGSGNHGHLGRPGRIGGSGHGMATATITLSDFMDRSSLIAGDVAEGTYNIVGAYDNAQDARLFYSTYMLQNPAYDFDVVRYNDTYYLIEMTTKASSSTVGLTVGQVTLDEKASAQLMMLNGMTPAAAKAGAAKLASMGVKGSYHVAYQNPSNKAAALDVRDKLNALHNRPLTPRDEFQVVRMNSRYYVIQAKDTVNYAAGAMYGTQLDPTASPTKLPQTPGSRASQPAGVGAMRRGFQPLPGQAQTPAQVPVRGNAPGGKVMPAPRNAVDDIQKNANGKYTNKAVPGKEYETKAEAMFNHPETKKEWKDTAQRIGILATDDVAHSYIKDVVEPKMRAAGTNSFQPSRKDGKAPTSQPYAGLPQYHKYNTGMISTIVPNTQQFNDIENKFKGSWDHMNHSTFGGRVNNVFRVHNSDNKEKRFQKMEKRINNTKSGLYHGTDLDVTGKVIGGDYKIIPATSAKAGRMLGDGIYVADKTSKSIQYISKSGFSRSTRERGTLFVNKVAMGQTIESRNLTFSHIDAKGNIMNKQIHAQLAQQYYPNSGNKRINTQYGRKNTSGVRHYSLVNDEWSASHVDQVLPEILIDVQRYPR